MFPFSKKKNDLDYFYTSRILDVRVAVIYALYLLYETQPKDLPKAKIRITLALWKEFLLVQKAIEKQKLYDAQYISLYLWENHAFYFTAFLPSKVFRANSNLSEISEDDKFVFSFGCLYFLFYFFFK